MRLGRMRLWVTIGSACGVTAALTGAVIVADEGPAAVAARTSALERQAGSAPAPDVGSYWTPKRMAAATPVDARSGQTPLAAQAAGKTAVAFGGIPTVGAVFFNNGNGDHFCSASVVNSYSKRLLLTAAHCIHGGKGRGYHQRVAFVPKYDRGSRPYGIWSAKRLFVDKRWASRTDADLDFGYIVLHPRNGRTIQAAVGGANRIAVNKSYTNTVNVTGYPIIRLDNRDRPIWCRTTTRKQSRYQIRMDCNGFHAGTSGSPWLLNYNGRTRTGSVNGVIGGYQGGGNVHWISYSPYFDQDVLKLKTFADRNA